jgi:hypothetical protein
MKAPARFVSMAVTQSDSETLSRHQSNSLQTCALCNLDHLGDLLKVHVFFGAHEDDLIGRAFEDSFQPGIQIFQRDGFSIERTVPFPSTVTTMSSCGVDGL